MIVVKSRHCDSVFARSSFFACVWILTVGLIASACSPVPEVDSEAASEAQAIKIIASYDNSSLSDCVIAANVLKFAEREASGQFAAVERRRNVYLIQDEWVRRLTKAETFGDVTSDAYRGDYAKQMLGALDGVDSVALAEAEIARCDNLIVALRARMGMELKYGND